MEELPVVLFCGVIDSVTLLVSMCDNTENNANQGSSPEPWWPESLPGFHQVAWLTAHRADLKFLAP